MTLPKPKQAHHRIETWCFRWRSIERVSADTTWHNSGSSLNETGLWKKDLNSWRSLLKKRNTDMLIHFCLLSVFIRNIDCWKKEIQKKTNWNEVAATSFGKKWKDSLNKNSSSQKIKKRHRVLIKIQQLEKEYKRVLKNRIMHMSDVSLNKK